MIAEFFKNVNRILLIDLAATLCSALYFEENSDQKSSNIKDLYRHSSYNTVLLYRGILSNAFFSKPKTMLNFTKKEKKMQKNCFQLHFHWLDKFISFFIEYFAQKVVFGSKEVPFSCFSTKMLLRGFPLTRFFLSPKNPRVKGGVPVYEKFHIIKSNLVISDYLIFKLLSKSWATSSVSDISS